MFLIQHIKTEQGSLIWNTVHTLFSFGKENLIVILKQCSKFHTRGCPAFEPIAPGGSE